MAVSRAWMSSGCPSAGLPAAHVGIHSGPVIAQDGDVYDGPSTWPPGLPYAQEGQVVVTKDTAHRSGRDTTPRFHPLRAGRAHRDLALYRRQQILSRFASPLRRRVP